MEQALGAGIGAVVGLITLVAGALFNAHLSRRRDDRLRREEQRALAAALFADFRGALPVLDDRWAMLDVLGHGQKPKDYSYRERLALPGLVCTDALRHQLTLLPYQDAQRTVLAVRAYEMAGMILKLCAEELSDGKFDPATFRERQRFIELLWQPIGVALESLASTAGIPDAWHALRHDPIWERLFK